MNLAIGKKILLGFGVIVALTLFMGWYGLDRLEEVNTITANVVDNDFKIMSLLQDLNDSRDDMKVLRERALSDYLLRKAGLPGQEPTAAQTAYRRAAGKVDDLLSELESVSAGLETSAVDPGRKQRAAKIRQIAGEARDILKETTASAQVNFEAMIRGELGQVAGQRASVDQARKAFDDKVALGIETIQGLTSQSKLDVAAAYGDARVSTLGVLAVVVILGTAIGLVIHRSITRPLGGFMQVVEGVGEGDLTRQAEVLGDDELGRMGQSLNRMTAGLKEVAGQTRGATENLNAAAAELLAAAQQQASSTTEQAAAVQETSTTMKEISESGTQIAERSKQVASSAEATSTASRAGLQAVQDTTRAIQVIREQAEAVAENIVALSEKTQAIGQIIATVTDIAEQSNLLALNAAIEAAAAGEQGRSFSVVASEMKNLAGQAKESTVQVRSILEEIQQGINSSVMLTEEAVKRVELGRQQTEVSERTIRQMADNLQESVNAFQQIVAATNQQQIGYEQVTQSLSNINQATSQTVSSTRQLEKAAASLSALGQQLQKAVEKYRL